MRDFHRETGGERGRERGGEEKRFFYHRCMLTDKDTGSIKVDIKFQGILQMET